jgi:MarR family transcriptional regulator, organic hydroperoxide resistance regulator
MTATRQLRHRQSMKISKYSRYQAAEDILSVLLRRVSGLWRRRLNEELAKVDLTEMQFVLLLGLAWQTQDVRDITQAQLGQHTQVHKALLSQVMKTLVRKDLVVQSHSEDSRTRSLRLSVRGQAKVRKALKILERTEDSFWTDIPHLATRLRKDLAQILRAKGAKPAA